MSRSSHVTVQVLERLGPNDLIDPAAWAPATTAAATLYPGERIVQPQRLDYTDYTLLCILHTLSLAFESLGQCRAEVSHVPCAPLSLLLNHPSRIPKHALSRQLVGTRALRGIIKHCVPSLREGGSTAKEVESVPEGLAKLLGLGPIMNAMPENSGNELE